MVQMNVTSRVFGYMLGLVQCGKPHRPNGTAYERIKMNLS